MNAPIPETELQLIRNELLAGRKVQAVKLYRESTGLDLFTSKRAVEAMEAEMRATTPQAFERPATIAAGSGGGLLLKTLLAVILAAAALYLMKQRSDRTAPPTSGPAVSAVTRQ
jgi:hypothetical protein